MTVPKAGGVGVSWCVDTSGPFPTAANGSRYAVTFTDRVTGFVEAYDIADKDMGTVVDVILDMIARWGIPALLLHDGGSEYRNSLAEAVSVSLGFPRVRIAVDHAESNPDERSHRTLLDVMRTQQSLVDDHSTWPRALRFAVMAVNSMLKDPLEVPASYLQFGRVNRQASDMEVALALDDLRHPKQPVSELVRQRMEEDLPDLVLMRWLLVEQHRTRVQEELEQQEREALEGSLHLRRLQRGDLVRQRARNRSNAAQGVYAKFMARWMAPVYCVVFNREGDTGRRSVGAVEVDPDTGVEVSPVRVSTFNVDDLCPARLATSELRVQLSDRTLATFWSDVSDDERARFRSVVGSALAVDADA